MKMKIEDLSPRYRISRLTDDDLPQLLSLCRTNPLFFQHCPPEASLETLAADLRALPPRKTHEDKYYLGFWMGEELVAALDLILRFPNEHTAFIGFFMLHAAHQGHGEGSRLIGEILSCLGREFSHVRLGYVKGNEQSMHFWHKNGFAETGVIVQSSGYEIVYTQKELHP